MWYNGRWFVYQMGGYRACAEDGDYAGQLMATIFNARGLACRLLAAPKGFERHYPSTCEHLEGVLESGTAGIGFNGSWPG